MRWFLGLIFALSLVACTPSSMNMRGSAQSNENFRPACDAGDMKACEKFAMQRYKAKQYREAANFLWKACDGGQTVSCCTLGGLYWGGRGVSKDMKKAEELLSRGCTETSDVCCNNLGALYLQENTERITGPQVMSIFERACSRGQMAGCYNLGSMHDYGQKIEKNKAKAVELYKQSCDAGYMPGCAALGKLYQRGQGVEHSNAQALILYRQACDGRHYKACRHAKHLQFIESCRLACEHSGRLISAHIDAGSNQAIEGGDTVTLDLIVRVQPHCLQRCAGDGALNAECALRAQSATELIPCNSF